MKLQLVRKQIALDIKELGFDWICAEAYWNDSSNDFYDEHELKNHNEKDYLISAPTQSLVCKWIRDVYNIHISILLNKFGNGYYYSIFDIKTKSYIISPDNISEIKSEYEQAEECGIIKTIEFIKSK